MLRLVLVVAAAAHVTLCFALVPFGVTAQDLDARARVHFESGTLHFDSGDYESALREFQAAYDLSHRPALQYNLYLCHERLGNLPEAIQNLEAFLASNTQVDNRQVLELRLENMRRRAAGTDTHTDAGASTGPDTGSGSDADTGSNVHTDVGGNDEENATDRTDERDDTGAGAHASGSTGGGVNVPAVISFIGAGVGAVLWATFGALAIDEDSMLDGSCMTSCPAEAVSDLATYDLLADIGFGVTVAGAALGVVFLLLDGGSDDASDRGARVTPLAGPSLAGVSVSGAL